MGNDNFGQSHFQSIRTMPKLHLSLSLLVGLLTMSLPAMAQTTNNTQPTTVGDNSNNNFIDNRPVQNANANTGNSNFINIPSIYPLPNSINTPVNTENDFGFNASVGMNTLDSSNVTVYVGIIFQPGRTDDHNQRMARLRKETEVLEMNKRLAQTQLSLLEQQIEESKFRLQQNRQAAATKKP
jgi:hypothetical protein